MPDNILLQNALRALEKYAFNKEEKLIQAIRERLKTPTKQRTVYILDSVKRKQTLKPLVPVGGRHD
jgi:ribosomal protein L18E